MKEVLTMDLMEAMLTRRSVRQWTSEPVSDEQLEQLVEAAARAPSGGNTQPWAFVVIRDETRLKRLRAAAPGVAGRATAVVLICLDKQRADEEPGTAEYDMVRDSARARLAPSTSRHCGPSCRCPLIWS
jgi:nitroreductase